MSFGFWEFWRYWEMKFVVVGGVGWGRGNGKGLVLV